MQSLCIITAFAVFSVMCVVLVRMICVRMVVMTLKVIIARLNSSSLHRDFAYVARDRLTRIHMCHVFRCDTTARIIANTLR